VSGTNWWTSYDSVVGIYEAVAVPWFTAMAMDLVRSVAPATGAKVLDAGTGTGLVARHVSSMGSPALVVGVDPSVSMLMRARTGPEARVIAGAAPGLPFARESFDDVVANLVLSHFPDLDAGIADLVRVLSSGGRLGATAWGPKAARGADNERLEADEIVDQVVKACDVAATPPVKTAPWEEVLRQPGRIERSLQEAGLEQVAVSMHTYPWTFAVEDYVDGWGGPARYMRGMASEARLREYTQYAAAALHERFGDTIRSVSCAWIAVGTKP
jgi:ubiquinone/menaquinone biosynthesis C-methylase UbiE